jgi:hypothetical protein
MFRDPRMMWILGVAALVAGLLAMLSPPMAAPRALSPSSLAQP